MAESTQQRPLTGAKEKDMAGKSVLITGANSGIGFETAVNLASRGASVTLACRRRDAAEAAASALRAAHPGADIRVIDCDLGSLDSVRRCADSFRKLKLPLHVLINNAGSNLYGIPPFYTKEGVGGCAMVNFLGAYALTRLLTPELQRSAPSRVVTVSSVMHRNGTLKPHGANGFLREYEKGTYAHAKLAEVLFSYEYDRRAAHKGIRAVAVDPGAVQTNIWQGTPLGHPIAKAVMDQLYAPPKEGAMALIHAATCPLDTLRGPSREPERLYFARGAFTIAPVTADRWLPWPLWGLGTLAASLLDQPVRALSRGRLFATSAAVESSPESFDRGRADELWSAAAAVAAMPESLF